MKTLSALFIWFAAIAVSSDVARAGQQSQLGTVGFPEDLLGGTSNFDLAILFHGDIRGNFGPCG
ncbi:MAG TPA: hypothetical protein VE398_01635 [Acidobacteriota bacterium]|nr:hypothetical protein [Acidobacteriota bacterium]